MPYHLLQSDIPCSENQGLWKSHYCSTGPCKPQCSEEQSKEDDYSFICVCHEPRDRCHTYCGCSKDGQGTTKVLASFILIAKRANLYGLAKAGNICTLFRGLREKPSLYTANRLYFSGIQSATYQPSPRADPPITDKDTFHHFNYNGQKVSHASSTPAEICLWVIWGNMDHGRHQDKISAASLTITQAMKTIDLVVLMEIYSY